MPTFRRSSKKSAPAKPAASKPNSKGAKPTRAKPAAAKRQPSKAPKRKPPVAKRATAKSAEATRKVSAPAANAASTATAGDAARYWLFKTEPETFSFDDLLNAPQRTTHWDGVRNYQARNFMREMRVGDVAFLYHSSTDPTAIVGVVRVTRTAYPDHTAFDAKDPHFDPKSKRDEPTWLMVDVEAVERLPHAVTLAELRESAALAGMELLRKGNRLSIQPVRAAEWDEVLRMGR